MDNFEFKKNKVIQASFKEDASKAKKKNINIKVNGQIAIPENKDEPIIIVLDCELGNTQNYMYLTLKTICYFEIKNDINDITEELVNKECLPIALAKLRKTISKVTLAYGMSELKLPPFPDENINDSINL